jgi:hypothetical protein
MTDIASHPPQSPRFRRDLMNANKFDACEISN